ncbi:MAG: hypothetical protein GY719_17770 [bacterium]|nr:hypothetical protein [bacterium]
MSDEIIKRLDELKAGQDRLEAGQDMLKAEVRSDIAGLRREINDKFEMIAGTLEMLSRHLGVRRAS